MHDRLLCQQKLEETRRSLVAAGADEPGSSAEQNLRSLQRGYCDGAKLPPN